MGDNLLENRVIRLEENSYFLEEKLKALDGQILAQQASLDLLEQNLRQIREALTDIRMLLSVDAKIPDARPPHYGPEPW